MVYKYCKILDNDSDEKGVADQNMIKPVPCIL